MLFNRRRTGSDRVGKMRLFDEGIKLSTQVKYIRAALDNKLNWVAHVKDSAQKALTAFWICRKIFGRNSVAMKTTVSEAMEILLAIPPVYVMIKAKAFASAERTPYFRTGHGQVCNIKPNLRYAKGQNESGATVREKL